jgi:NAD(P)H-nitrite reductase large subunit
MANKKGPLSKVESFYVDAQVKLGTSVENIATDLNRPQSSVESYIAKASKKKEVSATSDQFARQSGATIMTENASTMIDARRKKAPIPSKTMSCVTKIKNDN